MKRLPLALANPTSPIHTHPPHTKSPPRRPRAHVCVNGVGGGGPPGLREGLSRAVGVTSRSGRAHMHAHRVKLYTYINKYILRASRNAGGARGGGRRGGPQGQGVGLTRARQSSHYRPGVRAHARRMLRKLGALGCCRPCHSRGGRRRSLALRPALARRHLIIMRMKRCRGGAVGSLLIKGFFRLFFFWDLNFFFGMIVMFDDVSVINCLIN